MNTVHLAVQVSSSAHLYTLSTPVKNWNQYSLIIYKFTYLVQTMLYFGGNLVQLETLLSRVRDIS